MILDVAAVLRGTNATVLQVRADGGVAPAALSPADLRQPLTDVTIDSRLIEPNALFVALAGARADGHDFVGQALVGGARACLVSHIPTPHDLVAANNQSENDRLPADEDQHLGDKLLLQVADPLVALQNLATYWRTRHGAQVVGITGSIGKTTAKEIVASVLSSKWSVLKSEANFNTEIGLPLALLRLRSQHVAAVLEMGMYSPGDISLLSKIAQPDIGVVTNIAPIHLERMQTIERIAREKSALVAALPESGLAVLNGDDPWTRAMARSSGVCRVLLVGFSPNCDYRARDVAVLGLEGTSFTVVAENQAMSFRTRVPGVHTVHAFLIAVAIARGLGMSWSEIKEASEQVRLEVRQRLLRPQENLLIIDDSYNAAPLSMNAALDLLGSAPGGKIAVLGDMLELGQHERDAHRQVGEHAGKVADWLVVRGQRSKWIAEGAQRGGLTGERIREAGSNREAVTLVREIVSEEASRERKEETHTMQKAKAGGSASAAGWSVLVKASRAMQMEEVVQGLRGEG